MAIQLDPYQRIVGVGWGGASYYLSFFYVTDSRAGGEGSMSVLSGDAKKVFERVFVTDHYWAGTDPGGNRIWYDRICVVCGFKVMTATKQKFQLTLSGSVGGSTFVIPGRWISDIKLFPVKGHQVALTADGSAFHCIKPITGPFRPSGPTHLLWMYAGQINDEVGDPLWTGSGLSMGNGNFTFASEQRKFIEPKYALSHDRSENEKLTECWIENGFVTDVLAYRKKVDDPFTFDSEATPGPIRFKGQPPYLLPIPPHPPL